MAEYVYRYHQHMRMIGDPPQLPRHLRFTQCGFWVLKQYAKRDLVKARLPKGSLRCGQCKRRGYRS